jgi:hypothetical protein
MSCFVVIVSVKSYVQIIKEKAKTKLKQTGLGSSCPTQEKRFILIATLLSNPTGKTYELYNSCSNTAPSCPRSSHVDITTNHMGSFPIRKCPTLYVNDVDEDQKAT